MACVGRERVLVFLKGLKVPSWVWQNNDGRSVAACCVVVSPSWAFAALVPSPPCAFDAYLPAAWLLSAALRVGCATIRPGHACLTGMGEEDQPKGCANCQVIEMGAGDVMA